MFHRYRPEVPRASRQFPRHCDIRRRQSRLRHLRGSAAAVLPQVEARGGRRQIPAAHGRGGSRRGARRARQADPHHRQSAAHPAP